MCQHESTGCGRKWRRQEIGLALILGHENMFYYSNYKAIIYSRQIIITVDEKRVSAIVPGLEEDHAKLMPRWTRVLRLL